MTSTETCGNCRFARPVPVDRNNLAQASQLAKMRVCAGAPPCVIVVNGNIMQARPNMDATEPACALWKPVFSVVAN